MSTRSLVLVFVVGALLSPPAFAGPSAGYLCASDQPFDQFAVVDRGRGSAIAFRLPGRDDVFALGGRVPAGQSPHLKSRDGMMIVPLQVFHKPVVDIYFEQRRVARLPGRLQDADVGGRDNQLALVSVSQEVMATSNVAEVTQSVVTADGRILASRRFPMRLDEDGAMQFRLTGAGDGVYRLPSENTPVQALEVLDPRNFRTRLSIRAPDVAFTAVWMQSALYGFAIGNGQLYRIAAGKLRPMTTPEDAFRATLLNYDPRSDRLLAQGTDGFWVFDGQGKKLLGQRGLSAVRLTIEGDVVRYSGSKGEQSELWAQGEGYAEPTPISLEAIPNWNAVACLTSHSAAVMKPNAAEERGELVRFRE